MRLNPNSAEARTNLAANLSRLGKLGPAEEQFRKAAQLEPENFDANHNLGEVYVRAGKIAEATPFLEKAQRIDPSSYDNGYDLSLAYLLTGHTKDARELIHALLQQKNTAELHNLLAEVEEKDGNFVTAANEFEIAAHMDPSESNLFDWASELLVHRTLEPSIEIFRQATERYPQSSRLAIGLGMALYSLGKYDDAVVSLLRAADLSPSDPRIYPFLSRAYDSSPGQAGEVIKRFHRFADLQPRNGRALYYYAMSLWKGKRAQDPSLDLHQIESLLTKSIELDPTLADAQLQLGNLYSDQSKYSDAIPHYKRALELQLGFSRRPLPPGPSLRPHWRKGPRPARAAGISATPRPASSRPRQTTRRSSPIRLLRQRQCHRKTLNQISPRRALVGEGLAPPGVNPGAVPRTLSFKKPHAIVLTIQRAQTTSSMSSTPARGI